MKGERGEVIQWGVRFYVNPVDEPNPSFVAYSSGRSWVAL